MLPAAGKGERRNLRGSARLSSKMSGRPPRLRILRPRPQQRAGSDSGDVPVAEETSRPEGNLKEIERDARKRDARAASSGSTKAAAIANEMEDEDEDNNDEEEEELVTAEEDERGPMDGDLVAAEKSEEEVIELETNERNSYECKSCKPARTLPNIKAYFEHLRKEHKQKVREVVGDPAGP